MPLNTGNFASLLAPGLHTLWGLDYNQWEEEYSKVFTLDTSSKNYEDDQELSGFGLVPPKPQGRGITYDTAAEGGTKRYTHTTYGLGFSVTEEMYEDDLYRKIASLPKALAKSVRQTVETDAANILNRAFDSNYTGSDGKEMCATNHVQTGAGDGRNELSTSADLDVTSFEQALIDIQTLTDDRGLKVRAMPQKLIIHSNDAWMAAKILESGLEPDTANNAKNPGQNILPKGYTVMHWLTDTDAWFITTDIPKGLTHFWRRKPRFAKDNDWGAEVAKFKVTFRKSVSWTDWRAIFGSPGA